MSYINLHSYLTGQDVQYGLIEVGLKHEATNQDYGTTIQYSAQYWNTAPEANRWPKIEVNQSGKHQWIGGNEIFTAGCITGRPNSQGINDTGNLVSSYGSVYRGSRPIISNKVYTVDEFTSGENLVDLFDTDTVTVKLYVYKGYVSNAQTYSSSYNMTWQDEDDNSISEPEVLLEVAIKMYLKGTANEICRFSFTNSELTNTVFNKFTISTELFDIKGFVNNYYSEEYYDYRYNKWYDSNSFGGNKIHSNGEDVAGPITDVVVPTIAFISTDYYTSPRSYYNYKRHKIVKSDGSDLSDTEARRIASSGEIQFIEDQIDNHSTSFIKFCSALGLNGGYTPSGDFKDYINNVYNQSLGYKTKAEGTYISDIANNDNMQWSPLLLPLVDNNHVYMTYTQSGVFIPLTTDVRGGDPEPPGPGPEEVEEADDPDTDYNPDPSDGEEQYTYPTSDNITGEWDTTIPYEASYNNYVFADFKRDETSPWSNLRAYELVMDIANTSTYEWFAQHFDFVDKPYVLADIISRVYETPFSFVDLFQSISSPVGAQEAAPTWGYSGPLTMGMTYDSQNNKWDGNPLDTHYYYCAIPRIFTLNLGATSIQKVFNNYLDYETEYTLNLPYGAGSIKIDPNYLFPDGYGTGSIILKGYFDIDTGLMLINVKVSGQMYYQTVVNVAADKQVAAVNAGMQFIESVKFALATTSSIASFAFGTAGALGGAGGELMGKLNNKKLLGKLLTGMLSSGDNESASNDYSVELARTKEIAEEYDLDYEKIKLASELQNKNPLEITGSMIEAYLKSGLRQMGTNAANKERMESSRRAREAREAHQRETEITKVADHVGDEKWIAQYKAGGGKIPTATFKKNNGGDEI